MFSCPGQQQVIIIILKGGEGRAMELQTSQSDINTWGDCRVDHKGIDLKALLKQFSKYQSQHVGSPQAKISQEQLLPD